MFLAFSDKIFYIKGYPLGGQIYFEILINSIGGNTPVLCGKQFFLLIHISIFISFYKIDVVSAGAKRFSSSGNDKSAVTCRVFRSSMFSEVLEEYLEEDESLELQ